MKLRSYTLVLAAIVAASCQPEAAVETIVAIDVSKSTVIKIPNTSETLHDLLVNFCYLCGVHVRSKRDSIMVFKFGRDTTEIFSGYPRDKDAFGLLMQRELAMDEHPGTNYPVMLEKVAAAVHESSAGSIIIRIGGDGLDDFTYDKNLHRRFRDAAKAIAADARVKSVVIWGINSAGRGELREILGVLGSRLVLQSYMQDPFH